MQIIEKFPLSDTRDQSIYPPGAFTPLSAGVEMGQMCVWGIIGMLSAPCQVDVKIIGSSFCFESVDGFEFLGTVFYQGETKHIFYEP